MSILDYLKKNAGTDEDFNELLRKKKSSKERRPADNTQNLIDEYENTGKVTREMQSAINSSLGGKVGTDGMTSSQMGRMLQGEPVGLPFEQYEKPSDVGEKLKGALYSVISSEDTKDLKRKIKNINSSLFN